MQPGLALVISVPDKKRPFSRLSRKTQIGFEFILIFRLDLLALLKRAA
jgi:hypothetical protein